MQKEFEMADHEHLVSGPKDPSLFINQNEVPSNIEHFKEVKHLSRPFWLTNLLYSNRYKYFLACVMMFYVVITYRVYSLELFNLSDIKSKDYFDSKDQRTNKFFVELKIFDTVQTFRTQNQE